MVEAQTPTLAKIKNEIGLCDTRALLSIAICELCDFFNVGKNMNDIQIAMTADLIIEDYWHLHLEEIKYCFRRAMKRAKLFDRLDGNIILGWIEQYDIERTEEAVRISERREAQMRQPPLDSDGAMNYAQYVAELRNRAKTDDEAATLLAAIDNTPSAAIASVTPEERARKDHDFRMWKMFQYLPSKQPRQRNIQGGVLDRFGITQNEEQ